jgi:hypothetical protein
MSRHPAAGQDAHPLNAALHQATEIGHLPGHPGREGHQEAHHLEGKGPCQEPTTTTVGTGQKGQEMRENLTKGAKIIMIKAPFLDPEDKPLRLRTKDSAQLTTQVF